MHCNTVPFAFSGSFTRRSQIFDAKICNTQHEMVIEEFTNF